MATNKKSTPAPAAADSVTATLEAPAAKPAEAQAAAPKPAAAKAAARRTPAKAAAKAKPLDPAVQASKEALAKALAAAQAVKIEKPLGKPAKAEKPEKAEKAPKAEKEAKAPKARKPKLVRDSFTMPENEYACLAELKKRLLAKGVVAKKSELLRAGVALLAALGEAELAAVLGKVEVIKTGRPAKAGK